MQLTAKILLCTILSDIHIKVREKSRKCQSNRYSTYSRILVLDNIDRYTQNNRDATYNQNLVLDNILGYIYT